MTEHNTTEEKCDEVCVLLCLFVLSIIGFFIWLGGMTIYRHMNQSEGRPVGVLRVPPIFEDCEIWDNEDLNYFPIEILAERDCYGFKVLFSQGSTEKLPFDTKGKRVVEYLFDEYKSQANKQVKSK